MRMKPPSRSCLVRIQRVTISIGKIQIFLADASRVKRPIEIPWKPKLKGQTQIRLVPSEIESDPKLTKAIVRAHAWFTA
jgi:hypothetical protein